MGVELGEVQGSVAILVLGEQLGGVLVKLVGVATEVDAGCDVAVLPSSDELAQEVHDRGALLLSWMA